MKVNLVPTLLWTLGGLSCSIIIIITRISNTFALITLPLILIGTRIDFKSVNRYSLHKKVRI